jgi:hypothetical protein
MVWHCCINTGGAGVFCCICCHCGKQQQLTQLAGCSILLVCLLLLPWVIGRETLITRR